MPETMVGTVIGKDRTGLVESLARLRVTGSRKMAEIRRELETLGSELMVGISFTED